MQDTGAIYGAERATLDLAVGLRDAGEDPVFFLMHEQRISGESALRKAIDAAKFPVRDFRIAGRFSMAMARAVRVAFREVRGDVLHVLGYKAHLHAWLAGVRPRVSTVHGWLFRRDVKEQLYGQIEMVCLRRCDRVICLSRYYEELLLRRGISRDALRLIPSGLKDIPPAVVTGAPANPLTFGMMGRFSEEKNHAMFLAAADIVRRDFPAARFLIAGAGPLEKQIRSAAIADMPGYLPVDDFFQRIDVYVICSNIENLPYSILEAMARGKPVIGTRVGGIPDLVEDGKTGRLVASGQAGELAEAMMELIKNPSLVAHRGQAGRTKLDAEFDFASCIRSHQQLYRDVAVR